MESHFKIIKLEKPYIKEPEWGCSLREYVDKFLVQVINMKDRAIVDAIVRTAREEGIGEIILIDKKFIVEAINEKLERERRKANGELF